MDGSTVIMQAMGELKDRSDLKLELTSSMPDFVSTSVPHLSYSQAL